MNLIRWKELDSLDKLMNNFFGQESNLTPVNCASCKTDVYVKDNNIMGSITQPPFMAREKKVSSLVPIVVMVVASAVTTCKIERMFMLKIFVTKI